MRRVLAFILVAVLFPACSHAAGVAVSGYVDANDPGASTLISTSYPDVVARLRAAAANQVDSRGVRHLISQRLRENPRLLFPDLTETGFLRRLTTYNPIVGSAEDRAAAMLGIWIAENADTIQLEPEWKQENGRSALVWPGSRLVLDGIGILGVTDSAPAPIEFPEMDLPPGHRLSIVSTNDIHGQLLPYDAPFIRSDPPTKIGGMAAVATYVRTSRIVAAALGQPLLLLDAGDIYQGTPEGTMTKGHAMVPVLNELEYDAITIGNHEFDHGRENAEALIDKLDAPVLGANVLDSETCEIAMGLAPGILRQAGGLSVGIIGLLTNQMPTLTFGANIRGLTFLAETEAIGPGIEMLRGAGAKTVIALTHSGVGIDTMYLARQEGLDIVVGGHSHTSMEKAYVSPTGGIVIQTGGKTSGIARLDLIIGDAGEVETFAYKLVTLYADSFRPDPRMAAIIESATAGVTSEMTRVLGEAADPIPGSYREESPMGRLASDVLREWAKADVALISGGGIRSGFLEGPITRRNAFQVFPFGNELAIGAVRGDVLLRVIEHGVSTDRGRIQISGAVIYADSAAAAGSKVRRVEINGKPLDPNRVYRVTTDAFLAQGGSGYFAGEKLPWEIHADADLFKLLADHVEREKIIHADKVPRIKYE